ncbi:hypothetical protein QVD17_17225 [Tagetes erecta]|uniref:Uncharacterized protein n=1 Tax=Tagetes erecta TaxID=13708 RepID=A0AAD8KSN5_TARER|nr:hypothetical protein QVD17_17225 [Tagetes erecta]
MFGSSIQGKFYINSLVSSSRSKALKHRFLLPNLSTFVGGGGGEFRLVDEDDDGCLSCQRISKMLHDEKIPLIIRENGVATEEETRTDLAGTSPEEESSSSPPRLLLLVFTSPLSHNHLSNEISSSPATSSSPSSSPSSFNHSPCPNIVVPTLSLNFFSLKVPFINSPIPLSPPPPQKKGLDCSLKL